MGRQGCRPGEDWSSRCSHYLWRPLVPLLSEGAGLRWGLRLGLGLGLGLALVLGLSWGLALLSKHG